MSFVTRMRATLGSNKPIRKTPPKEIPNVLVFHDRPSTVDEQYIHSINMVASWLSHIGKPRRGYNKVKLKMLGAFTSSTFDFKYDIDLEYDAVNQHFKGSGLIKYYDMYLNESYRQVRINTQNPQDVYQHINSLYMELVRPQMK